MTECHHIFGNTVGQDTESATRVALRGVKRVLDQFLVAFDPDVPGSQSLTKEILAIQATAEAGKVDPLEKNWKLRKFMAERTTEPLPDVKSELSTQDCGTWVDEMDEMEEEESGTVDGENDMDDDAPSDGEDEEDEGGDEEDEQGAGDDEDGQESQEEDEDMGEDQEEEDDDEQDDDDDDANKGTKRKKPKSKAKKGKTAKAKGKAKAAPKRAPKAKAKGKGKAKGRPKAWCSNLFQETYQVITLFCHPKTLARRLEAQRRMTC